MNLGLGPAPVLSESDRSEIEDAPDPDLFDIALDQEAADATERDAMEEWAKGRQWAEKFADRADALSTSQYRRFLATIARLEMPSLTDTTRSLIAVEALGKDLRGDQPTVEGHIDVATITLRDGFTWVSDQVAWPSMPPSASTASALR